MPTVHGPFKTLFVYYTRYRHEFWILSKYIMHNKFKTTFQCAEKITRHVCFFFIGKLR